MMKPEMAKFWTGVRHELRQQYGQESGKRDRNKALQREQLAQEIGLATRTLKGFLNENQAGLGPRALVALLEKIPALELLYQEAMGHHNGSTTLSSGGTGTRADHGFHVQMTLQFDGFDDQPEPLVAHLPPGRQGVVILRIDSGRVA
jgi:hypothetical protein